MTPTARDRVIAEQVNDLLTQADMGWNVMTIMCHRLLGWQLAGPSPLLAKLLCRDCNAEATLSLVRAVGDKHVAVLLLPEGHCRFDTGTGVSEELCKWLPLPSYTNDAPDGESDGR